MDLFNVDNSSISNIILVVYRIWNEKSITILTKKKIDGNEDTVFKNRLYRFREKSK